VEVLVTPLQPASVRDIANARQQLAIFGKATFIKILA
jgi:hypothetical protein